MKCNLVAIRWFRLKPYEYVSAGTGLSQNVVEPHKGLAEGKSSTQLFQLLNLYAVLSLLEPIVTPSKTTSITYIFVEQAGYLSDQLAFFLGRTSIV